MRKIENPQLSYEEIYDSCIENIQNTESTNFRRNRLINIKSELLNYADQYNQFAQESRFYELPINIPSNFDISTSELTKLYTNKLSKKKTNARKYYLNLLSLPKHETCPFCSQRKVSTLDHYLPKEKYPLFSVYPLNLIASCKDCNFNKSTYSSTKSEDQLLHPYFDDLDLDIWLYAKVIQDPHSPAVIFKVRPPSHWEKTIEQRLINHFNVLKLYDLYTSHAGSELISISSMMQNLFDQGGSTLLRTVLQDLASSYREAYMNSWQAAMYAALSENAWYCDWNFQRH